MTPLTLPIAELKPALTGLSKVINLKSTLPVLHHIKIERTSDGWIALTSTDLSRFITIRLEHPSEGPPVALLIPYDQILQLTKNCGKDERLIIDPTPHGPVIKFALANNLGESEVKPLPVEEFPQTPRIKSDPIPLPPELRRSIREAMDCASTDNTRYILNCAFIDARAPKANYVVGTDGRHLYSANSFSLPLKDSVLIPSHKFLDWKEFNSDGEWQMRADNTHVQLSSRRWRFISKQIEGHYPDWRAPIPNPSDARTHVTIDPAKLEAVIKLIQRLPCHDDRFGSIGVEVSKGQTTLLAKENNKDPWVRVPIPDTKAEGPELTIFLDRSYFIKALQFGLNTISLSDQLSPLRFHCKGKQMIVMPLRPDAAQSQPPVNNKSPVHVRIPSPVQPQERKPMISNPAPEGPPPANTPPPKIEDVFEGLHQVRESLQFNAGKLKDLTNKLRFIHREQRTNDKEVNTLRSTLRSLQSLKL